MAKDEIKQDGKTYHQNWLGEWQPETDLIGDPVVETDWAGNPVVERDWAGNQIIEKDDWTLRPIIDPDDD